MCVRLPPERMTMSKNHPSPTGPKIRPAPAKPEGTGGRLAIGKAKAEKRDSQYTTTPRKVFVDCSDEFE